VPHQATLPPARPSPALPPPPRTPWLGGRCGGQPPPPAPPRPPPPRPRLRRGRGGRRAGRARGGAWSRGTRTSASETRPHRRASAPVRLVLLLFHERVALRRDRVRLQDAGHVHDVVRHPARGPLRVGAVLADVEV